MPQIESREKRLDLHLPVHVSGRDKSSGPFAETAATVNVSGGGICFATAREIPVGARIDLHIELPPRLRRRFGGRTTYDVRAVVCRLEPRPGEGGFHVGARFLDELEA